LPPAVATRVPQGSRIVGPAIVVALLIVLLITAAVFVGTQRRLPAPFGPAANGRIAFTANDQIWTAEADGTAPRQVTPGALGAFEPSFSRDGTHLAYRRKTSDEPLDDPHRFADLIVVDTDGANPVVIEAHLAGLGNPTWAPGDDRIAYTHLDAAGDDHLYVAAVDGSGVADLGTLGGSPWGPAWSNHGEWIAVGLGQDSGRLAIVRPDGTDVRDLSRGAYEEVGSHGNIASWSLDDKRLVFSAGSIDGARQIYLVGLDGAPEQPVSPFGLRADDPSWSPDGSLIAYLREGANLGPIVVILDRAGRELRILPGHYRWSQEVWSPDATRLFVDDDRPGNENVPGDPVMVALDPLGQAPAEVIRAPPGTRLDVQDGYAGTWQRRAP
ncbi:MAG: TolB family protein, partial [Chloroflexota bacterium]